MGTELIVEAITRGGRGGTIWEQFGSLMFAFMLLVCYVVLDGFDIGRESSIILSRDQGTKERCRDDRIQIHGPVWDGNRFGCFRHGWHFAFRRYARLDFNGFYLPLIMVCGC